MKQLNFAPFLLILYACSLEPKVAEVMRSCEYLSDFKRYNECIQTTFKRNYADGPVTRAFFALMDSIEEDYENNKLSDMEARAEAQKALMGTYYKL